MKFKNQSELVFLGIQNLKSKATGKPFSIVKLADPVTYENADFFPSCADDWNTLAVGSTVDCALVVSGRFTSIERLG